MVFTCKGGSSINCVTGGDGGKKKDVGRLVDWGRELGRSGLTSREKGKIPPSNAIPIILPWGCSKGGPSVERGGRGLGNAIKSGVNCCDWGIVLQLTIRKID